MSVWEEATGGGRNWDAARKQEPQCVGENMTHERLTHQFAAETSVQNNLRKLRARAPASAVTFTTVKTDRVGNINQKIAPRKDVDQLHRENVSVGTTMESKRRTGEAAKTW